MQIPVGVFVIDDDFRRVRGRWRTAIAPVHFLARRAGAGPHQHPVRQAQRNARGRRRSARSPTAGPRTAWHLVLAHTGGNQLKAAEILGLNRNTLRKKLAGLGIEQARKRAGREDRALDGK